MSVEAGADGGAAEGDFVKIRQGHLDAFDVLADLVRVRRELLAEGQRHCIHQMGAADLDDVRKLVGLGSQNVPKVAHRRQELVDDAFDGRNMHRGWERVVGGLPPVDVVVWVDGVFGADLAARELYGAVRDHLVGVHVGLGAAPSLPHDEREVLVEAPVDDLL